MPVAANSKKENFSFRLSHTGFSRFTSKKFLKKKNQNKFHQVKKNI